MMSATASPAHDGDDEGTPDATQETSDPVCGEIFPPELAVFHSEHAGRRYYFCSATCKQTFDAAPDEHLPEGSP